MSEKNMTVDDYKNKLRELHVLIKENPFRRDYRVYVKYGKGYFDLVHEFAETFYHLSRDIRDKKVEITSNEDVKLGIMARTCRFIHDFYAASNRSANCIFVYNQDGQEKWITYIHEIEELLELCITCVHCYLDTGLFNRYPVKGRKKIYWAEWDDEKKEFVVSE